MNQYLVKVKDATQSITHTMTETADTPNEANSQALTYLRKHVGDNEYTLSSCKPLYRQYTYANIKK